MEYVSQPFPNDNLLRVIHLVRDNDGRCLVCPMMSGEIILPRGEPSLRKEVNAGFLEEYVKKGSLAVVASLPEIFCFRPVSPEEINEIKRLITENTKEG